MRHSSQIKSIDYLMGNAADIMASLPEEQSFLSSVGHGVAAHRNETAFDTHLETLALLRMMAASQGAPESRDDAASVTDRAA